MHQIKETDFLWRCYKRFYRDYDGSYSITPPHPKSICNYFWKSMGGLLKIIFLDINILLIGIPFLLFFASAVYVVITNVNSKHNNVWLVLAIILHTSAAVICLIVLYGIRIQRYVEKNPESREVVGGGIIYFFSVVMFAALWHAILSYEQLGWLPCILGLVSLPGIILICIGISVFYTWLCGDTSTAAVVRGYFKALKDKVCPLVKIPSEEKEQ